MAAQMAAQSLGQTSAIKARPRILVTRLCAFFFLLLAAGAEGSSTSSHQMALGGRPVEKNRTKKREKSRDNKPEISLAGQVMLSDALRMQVTWTMVRSKVTSFGATSRNENYRELWHLWRNADGVFLLISPRAKISVYLATPDQSLVTTEGGLATLLGLLPDGAAVTKARGNQVSAAMTRPVAIPLIEPRAPVPVQYNFGGEESYAIQFEIQSLDSE